MGRSRVDSLKATMADLKKRVQSLEVDVTGLIQKSARPVPAGFLMAQEVTSSTSNAKSIDMHVALLEKEMAALKKTTGALEAKVGHKAAVSSLITEASQRIVDVQHSDGGPLKKRVIALEADAADVKSRVTDLEEEVLGTKGLSLLEASRTEVDTGSLESRVLALKATVVDLQGRVSTLKQRVIGR